MTTHSHSARSESETNAAATTSAAPTPSTSIASPPADAKIPAVPATAGSASAADFKGVQPKASEQAALAGALEDLKKFSTYAQLLPTAPPIAHTIVLLTLGVEWTGMHNATSAWDAYCRAQEGLVWAQIRIVMDRLKPSWNLAVQADPSLASQFPGLASLLGAKSAIAAKAVATKAANKKAIAEGKPPLHGAVGKRRKKAAQNAAYAAATVTTMEQPAASAATAGTAAVTPGTVGRS